MPLPTKPLALLAAACALLLLLLAASPALGGAIVVADGFAAGGAAEGALALPRRGDTVHYRAAEGGSFAFRWNGTGEREDAFGALVPVDLVVGAIDWGSGRPLVFEAAYPAGIEPLAYAWTLGGGGRGGPILGTYSWEGAYRSFGDFPNTEACLMRAAWQGAPALAMLGRSLGEVCPGLTDGDGSRASPFRDLGEEEVRGARARVLEAAHDASHGLVTVRVWLVEGLAYPVRATLSYAYWHGYVSTREYELVGFEPGADPLAAPAASALHERRPGARFAPLDRWSLVEGDAAAFPFPPSEAIAAFRDPVVFSGFHEYLATHPEARVVQFSLQEDQTSRQAAGGRPWVWSFTLNDASGEAWRVQARKLASLSGPVALPLPATAVVGADLGPLEAPPLDPATLPASGVALSDLLADWSDARAPGDGSANWVWGLLQVEMVESFHGVPAFIRVGHRDAELQASADAGAADATLAAWRDYDPRTGATTGEASGRFGDVYAVRGLGREAPSGWSVPPAVEEARALRGIALPAALGLAASALVLWSPERALRLVVPLFTRLARGEVLAHPRRAALLGAIREEPGVHGARLAERLGLGNGALLYHLAVLERERVVAAVQDGRMRRYFAAGSLARADMMRASLLATPSFRRLHDVVAAEPGISLKDAAARAGLATNTAHHAVDRLVEAGLVRRERRGRAVALYAIAPDPLARFA